MCYYEPPSAGINLQSPQSDSTPWTLSLQQPQRVNPSNRCNNESDCPSDYECRWGSCQLCSGYDCVQGPNLNTNQCNFDSDCRGSNYKCRFGSCRYENKTQCNSNIDCPGFPFNKCRSGRCQYKNNSRCKRDTDCPRFPFQKCSSGSCKWD